MEQSPIIGRGVRLETLSIDHLDGLSGCLLNEPDGWFSRMYGLNSSEKLKAAKIRFVIEPHIRFKGQVGEQATMFLMDPSGNAIEFKAFQDIAGQLFKK